MLLFFFSILFYAFELALNANLVKTVHVLFYGVLLFARFSVSWLTLAFSYF